MESMPKTQVEAKALGVDRYFTGEPCRNGHAVPRYTACRQCVTCTLGANAAWRARNPERQKAAVAAWRARNPERQKAAVAARRARNREETNARTAAWRAENPEKTRLYAVKRHHPGATPETLDALVAIAKLKHLIRQQTKGTKNENRN